MDIAPFGIQLNILLPSSMHPMEDPDGGAKCARALNLIDYNTGWPNKNGTAYFLKHMDAITGNYNNNTRFLYSACHFL